MNSYLQMDIEEILKETETAFLVKFTDGEEGWILKLEVACSTSYSVGDRNVVMQLFSG